MWIGERITENGVGNGISLLIFAGIISNFAGTIGSYIYTLLSTSPSSRWATSSA